MTESGVIPTPEDRQPARPWTWLVSQLSQMNGENIRVVVDYDTVIVGAYRFSRAQAEEFAHVFVSACWDAARNAERMSQEISVPP